MFLEHTRSEELITLKQATLRQCDVFSFCKSMGGQVALEVEVEGLFDKAGVHGVLSLC